MLENVGATLHRKEERATTATKVAAAAQKTGTGAAAVDNFWLCLAATGHLCCCRPSSAGKAEG